MTLRVCTLILITSLPLAAQSQNLAPQTRRTQRISDMMNGLGFVKPAPGLIGDPYFNKHWDSMEILLTTGHVITDPLIGKYDIHNNEIVIKTATDLRAIPASKVEQVSFTDSASHLVKKLVNPANYEIEGTRLAQMMEVLAEGNISLFRVYTTTLRDPDYNPALNSGSRDFRIIKNSELYAARGKELIKVKGKKRLLQLLESRSKEIEAYIKSNKLGGDDYDLAKIVDYYNSLN